VHQGERLQKMSEGVNTPGIRPMNNTCGSDYHPDDTLKSVLTILATAFTIMLWTSPIRCVAHTVGAPFANNVK